ncbi:hypothetical protein E2C01_044755 [Portunus trituberculatus]|uniref:Uncharacterized protein n=1 Tax=Portunus trituberculatus TaxID=210409 RepID=A0A5B7FWF2_PORTR|nr:hypothetical protein [Portunus trituberculatus]
MPSHTEYQHHTTQKGPILLGRAQPVKFFMEQADSAYLWANEKKPTSVGYPSGRFAKIYSVAGQEVYGKAALVNPSLHAALNPSARGLRPLSTRRWPGWRVWSPGLETP